MKMKNKLKRLTSALLCATTAIMCGLPDAFNTVYAADDVQEVNKYKIDGNTVDFRFGEDNSGCFFENSLYVAASADYDANIERPTFTSANVKFTPEENGVYIVSCERRFEYIYKKEGADSGHIHYFYSTMVNYVVTSENGKITVEEASDLTSFSKESLEAEWERYVNAPGFAGACGDFSEDPLGCSYGHFAFINSYMPTDELTGYKYYVFDKYVPYSDNSFSYFCINSQDWEKPSDYFYKGNDGNAAFDKNVYTSYDGDAQFMDSSKHNCYASMFKADKNGSFSLVADNKVCCELTVDSGRFVYPIKASPFTVENGKASFTFTDFLTDNLIDFAEGESPQFADMEFTSNPLGAVKSEGEFVIPENYLWMNAYDYRDMCEYDAENGTVKYKFSEPANVYIKLAEKSKLIKKTLHFENYATGKPIKDMYSLTLTDERTGKILYKNGSVSESSVTVYCPEGDVWFDIEPLSKSVEFEKYDLYYFMVSPEDESEEVSIKLRRYDYNMKGDLNGDGSESVADLITMQNFLMGNEYDIFPYYTGDMNGDGAVDVFDSIVLRHRIILDTNAA